MSAIASRIKTLRELRGLSQNDIANRLGISRPTYIAVESGRRQLTITDAFAIAKILETSADELILGKKQTDSDAPTYDFDIEKYKEVLLNCLEYGAAGDRKIPKTKLAKLIYLVDFNWFYLNHNPVTGARYRRIEHGPVANVFFRVIDELEVSGLISIEAVGQARMVKTNLREAPRKKLSSDELKLIKSIAKHWKNRNTHQIVEFTHNQIPWRSVEPGQYIPYESILSESKNNLY